MVSIITIAMHLFLKYFQGICIQSIHIHLIHNPGILLITLY